MNSKQLKMGCMGSGHTMSKEECRRLFEGIPRSRIVTIDPLKEFELLTNDLCPSATGVDNDGNRTDKKD